MIEIKRNNLYFNEEINTCLNRIIKNKSFANGYIFYGAEGVGKKQTALDFIKKIFKQDPLSKNIEEKTYLRNKEKINVPTTKELSILCFDNVFKKYR